MNQKLAVHLLNTKLGYCVDAVANGKEAIESLSRQDYDLVLMDCQMPVMDGHEATVAIRRPDSSVLNHDIPIIAMTAGAMKGDKEKCLASGMDDYVTKPIRLQNLVDAIERNLPADDDASEQRQDDEAPQEKQPTESRCTKAPYDRSLAFDHMEGDADMFREFAELFITHGPKMLAKVQECVSRGDPEAVAKAASAFEDLLDILAADTALLAAQAVKTLAQSGDLASLQESAADLAVEIRRLETALQRDTAAAEACD